MNALKHLNALKPPIGMSIDTSKIPAADVRVLCATLLDAVQRFYAEPENQRQFEAWQSENESVIKEAMRND